MARKNLVTDRSRYSPAARGFIARVIRRELRAGVPFNQAIAIAHSEARRRGYKVPARPNPSVWKEVIKTRTRIKRTRKAKNPRKRRRRNQPLPTIGDELIDLRYTGGSDKKKSDAFIHTFETKAHALPAIGGVVELADGQKIKLKPGSILLESKDDLPLWMEER